MALSEAVFEDHFPSMMLRLGAEGFVGELCNGFRLLMDCEKGVITYESLKINSLLLGLDDMAEDEITCMLREGDLDGDGNIDQFEFCILMCRMSPVLMDGSMQWMWMSSEVCQGIIQPGVSTA